MFKKYYERNVISDHYLAHSAVYRAIKKGVLIRLSCEVCGEPKSHAHHWKGYEPEDRLNVQWLCAQHHYDAHKIIDKVE